MILTFCTIIFISAVFLFLIVYHEYYFNFVQVIGKVD